MKMPTLWPPEVTEFVSLDPAVCPALLSGLQVALFLPVLTDACCSSSSKFLVFFFKAFILGKG